MSNGGLGLPDGAVDAIDCRAEGAARDFRTEPPEENVAAGLTEMTGGRGDGDGRRD